MIPRNRVKFIVEKVSKETESNLTSACCTRLENELTRALTEEYEGQNDIILVMNFLSKAQKLMKERANPDIIAAKLQYEILGVPYMYHKFLHSMIFYAYEYGKAEGSNSELNVSKIQTVVQKVEKHKHE